VGEGTATFRPSLVGRLDRDTSGVQLAGKSPEGLRGLEALSRAHKIRKVYLALVRGGGLPDSGRIDSPLRDRGSGRARMEVVTKVAAEDGIAAVTGYRVLARGDGVSLVEVEPRTGRRHQIRAHLAHLGAPLAGDVRYGDRAWNAELRSRLGLRRLFLHCASASFTHPVAGAETAARLSSPRSVSSPLPRELSDVLTKLGIRVARDPNS
jgi:RluA family pseudouridine synthase